jgi:hypothetical protein
MLADRRSEVWVTLDPVGVVMRERDYSRTQGVDNAAMTMVAVRVCISLSPVQTKSK